IDTVYLDAREGEPAAGHRPRGVVEPVGPRRAEAGEEEQPVSPEVRVVAGEGGSPGQPGDALTRLEPGGGHHQHGREASGTDDHLLVIFRGCYGDLRDYQVPLGDPIRRQRPAVFVQVFTANGEPPVVFGNGQPPRDTAAAQEVIALAFTFDLD